MKHLILETSKAPREFMTPKEIALKKRLIALLKDDGKGHKHAKYAERLADYDIKLASKYDENFPTAAIDFDTGTIYINEGFLDSPDTFDQLNVLIRHEMAHNLLMHQIRMIHIIEDKYGKDSASHFLLSKSLHSLMNDIEDFEISNTRYTENDKQIVRNMWLNGELISGLITDDIRKGWKSLSVEQMYKELTAEISQIQNTILNSWATDGEPRYDPGQDFIKNEIKNAYLYIANSNPKTPSNFLGKINDFIENKALYHFAAFDSKLSPAITKMSNLPPEWQDIIKALYNEFGTKNYKKQFILDIINKIAKTNPTDVYSIISDQNNIITKVYTPEEKFLAIDVLKAILPTLELYQTWYDKVTKIMGDQKYSESDIKNINDKLKKDSGNK